MEQASTQEQQPLQEQQPVQPQQATQEDYDQLYSMENYDKPVKRAQTTLFIIAGIEILSAVVTGVTGDMEPLARLIAIIITLLISALFIALGFWTKYKPYSAIITALVIYSALIIMNAIVEPGSLFKGILVKIGIYSALVVSISNARDVQRWKESQK